MEYNKFFREGLEREMDCLNANWKILKRNLERLNELQQIRESTYAQSQGLDWLIWLVMGIIGLIWRRTIIGRFWIVLVLIWHLLIISLRIWMTIWRLIYSKIMGKLPTSIVHTFLLSKASSVSYHCSPVSDVLTAIVLRLLQAGTDSWKKTMLPFK